MTGRELDRFRRMEAIFDAAVEYPPGVDRNAFLAEQCESDPPMLDEVRQLLEDHERVRAAAPEPPEALPQFGAWRAIRLLGRGGMGTVYLAERSDGAFRMSAAVKVVPLALASVDIEERFCRERQFLATLDHPKVARLIDGGVTSSGLPYLVMEFVDGLTIERYCEAEKLDASARILLMRQVLEALIYVHGRGVIHRDLKPSNILVDAHGNAKLLDFGTARLVDASGDTAITKTGVFAFTPECASPEQVQGKALTFASDIYSSGVLLYRLLTGRIPYTFTDYSPSAIADRISHTEPEPSGLTRPLDAILATTLHKNPAERYASAAEMDADLARYLEGQPVKARRPRKWPKLALAAAVIVVCAMAAWAFLKGSESGQASIAVLPFTNSDAQSRYLSSGLTSELTEALSRLKTLRVIAPASVAQFNGKTIDVREAGRLLHVANLVEGSVDQTGDRVRVVARLERVSDGASLWSETYERPASDLLSLQSELASGIARSLKVVAAPEAKHIPIPEAHDYVLKGRFEAQQMTTEALKQAEADFQRAIDLDPQYALAYFELGAQKYNESTARLYPVQTEEERRSIDQLIQKALLLDPSLQPARGVLAMQAMQYDWDWDRAEKHLRMGRAEASSPGIEQAYAFLLTFRGRFAEADEHVRRLQDLDPFSTASMNDVMQVRFLEGRFDEARGLAEKMSSSYPKMLAPKVMIAGTNIMQGRSALALQELERWKADFPPAQMFEAMAYAHAGNREEALRLMRPYEEKYPQPGVPLQWFALAYGLLGDEPATVKWLGRSADRHEWQALNLAVQPVFAPMRNSAGFRALKERIRLNPR